jgi:hypothetical protein
MHGHGTTSIEIPPSMSPVAKSNSNPWLRSIGMLRFLRTLASLIPSLLALGEA